MHMEPGKLYKIRLEYFENVGTATARFGIAAATQALGAETKALASKADAVVLCVGFDPSIESEGGDRTFRLPGGQDALIQQILEVNKNVIVVLTAGGNVDMTPWIDQVPALLHTGYPWREGAVSGNVKNTGWGEGGEVVEVYVGDSDGRVPRPVKELKGFAKVHLRPGETKRVTVSLDRRAFSFYDVEKNNWKAEPGKFSIRVGSSSEKIERQGEVTLSQ